MSDRRLAVITGASSGIGAELAALHAREGWDVVMVNRSAERSRPVIDEIRSESPAASIDVVTADLADHDSIATAAAALDERGPIDLFYNNAGVLLAGIEMSKYGIEMHAQVNTIAPYLFTMLLQPALKGSTVLTVSTSAINNTGPLRVDELAHPPTFKKLLGPYAQSKLAASTLMAAFAPQYPDTTFRSGEPGAVKTKMTTGDAMPKLLVPARNLFFSTPAKAAARVHDAATNTDFDTVDGAFIQKGKVKALPASATDPDVQQALLHWCREVTGV